MRMTGQKIKCLLTLLSEFRWWGLRWVGQSFVSLSSSIKMEINKTCLARLFGEENKIFRMVCTVANETHKPLLSVNGYSHG